VGPLKSALCGLIFGLLPLSASATGVVAADFNGRWARVGAACDGGQVELVITGGHFTSISEWPGLGSANSWGVFQAEPTAAGDRLQLHILHIGHKDVFDLGERRRVRDFFFNKAVHADLSLSLERIDGQEFLVLRGHDRLRAASAGSCATDRVLFLRR
jgi:hypothetical protein